MLSFTPSSLFHPCPIKAHWPTLVVGLDPRYLRLTMKMRGALRGSSDGLNGKEVRNNWEVEKKEVREGK